MESARNKFTREIVEAEELWQLPSVDRNGYECGSCGMDVYPASYQKNNLKRPYFSLFHFTDHRDGCDVEGNKKTVAKGRKGSVRDELETSPGLSPSRLTLRDERVAVDPTLPVSSTQTSSTRSVRSDAHEEKARPVGRRAANTIRPICRAYLNFPYDRSMSLDVPGIDGKTYLSAFKKLGAGNKGIEQFARAQIFYAELAWPKAHEDEESLLIPLSAGEWSQERKLVRPYSVRVCWSQWSKYKKTVVRNEMEVVREEGIKAKKKNPKDRAYVFFIGEQDESDPTVFNVSDHRLICGLLGTLIFVS
ncbi:hypothetical protein OO258_02100 [Pseudomonas sp. DCB_BI]|uniref:hypothetical protein n=1 Tax=Pseudomonas sp. DCB_BI TaxID=2993594 RepID=UPI00224B0F5F|nr:hypothetical protein [Pseudomonas sp. DCB_BI]MCX2887017.1 hypothetical protein [Pseudomonas sp. DCB_BI]